MPTRNDSMNVDLADGADPSTPSKVLSLDAVPVAAGSSGCGLPFAPENWPNPGDTWKWKAGFRKTTSGHWVDRYLFPPERFKLGNKKFASKLSVKEYIQKEFPGANVDEFFASFIWRIPSDDVTAPFKDADKNTQVSSRKSDSRDIYKPEPTVGCKAGNKLCSFQAKLKSYGITWHCDICCSEPGFCRNCCCILCSKTIDWANGDCGFIRCEAKIRENHICGHVAHVDCAIRCYMAGTIGGSINLDVEYYCRRCDSRSDLISYVERILEISSSLNSREDTEKILNMGLYILQGSEKTEAKNLKDRITTYLSKLKDEANLKAIRKLEKASMFASGDELHVPTEITMFAPLDIEKIEIDVPSIYELDSSQGIDVRDDRGLSTVFITSDHTSASLKLENDIDNILKELKRSQEREYKIAEQKLHAHKDHILKLYEQLDAERSELDFNGGDEAALSHVLSKVGEIKQEQEKLHEMMKISEGFGRTAKNVICKHFDYNMG